MKRAGFLAISAGTAAYPRAAFAQAAPIRLAGYPVDSYAEPLYAQELGYFKREGLNVDVSILPTAALNVQMVVSEAIDVCLADAIQIAHPVNVGVPLSFLAGGSLYASQRPTTLLVAAHSGIRSAKDVEGQTVAIIGPASIGLLRCALAPSGQATNTNRQGAVLYGGAVHMARSGPLRAFFRRQLGNFEHGAPRNFIGVHTHWVTEHDTCCTARTFTYRAGGVTKAIPRNPQNTRRSTWASVGDSDYVRNGVRNKASRCSMSP